MQALNKRIKIISILAGIIEGYFSSWYLFLIYLFLVLALETKGTYEWQENSIFVPVSIILFIVWISVFVFAIFRRKKDKTKLLDFLISFLVFFGMGWLRIYASMQNPNVQGMGNIIRYMLFLKCK